MTKAERKSVWETRVAQYRASGQSASAWCAENKVSLCQLYYWLKKNGAQPPVWIPVEIQEPSGYPLIIRLTYGTRVLGIYLPSGPNLESPPERFHYLLNVPEGVEVTCTGYIVKDEGRVVPKKRFIIKHKPRVDT